MPFTEFKTRAEAEQHRYGSWAGFPKGHKFDPFRCAQEVSSDYLFHQCQRKPGHGPDALYCKQHAKAL
jgi:hypothetical protein